MTHDQIMRTVQPIVESLTDGQRDNLALEIRADLQRRSKEAEAEARKIALQLWFECETLPEVEQEALLADVLRLQSEAKVCAQRSETYAEIKKRVPQVTVVRSLS